MLLRNKHDALKHCKHVREMRETDGEEMEGSI